MRDLFRRVATWLHQGTYAVPIEFVKRSLYLDKNSRFSKQDTYNYRYLASLWLSVNGMQRPGPTAVFETNPKEELVVTIRSKYIEEPLENRQVRFRSGAVAVAFEYQNHIFSKDRGFAFAIRPRMVGLKERDLPIVFGLYGNYGEDGMLRVKRLIVGKFDDNGNLTGTQMPEINERNVKVALTYGGLLVRFMMETGTLRPQTAKMCMDKAFEMNTDQPPTPRGPGMEI